MEKKLRTGNAYGTAPKGLKLPDTVYRQALWAARDLPRYMKNWRKWRRNVMHCMQRTHRGSV